MNYLKKTTIALAIIAGALILAFLLMIFSFYAGYWSDFRKQRTHLYRVRAMAKAMDMSHDESVFSTFTSEDDLNLNQIQIIASHNSYHHQPGELRLFFVGLVEPDEPDMMRYTRRTLWDQLDDGVRSFELDIRYKKRGFEIVHVPLVGNRGHSPDFILALEELRLWSETHPDHVPLMILLEFKDDMMELDPFLLDHTKESFDEIDEVILATMGRENLLIPDDVRGNHATLNKAVTTDGWPLLSSVRGKVVFILHENASFRSIYIDEAPALEGRMMFTCAAPGDADASVILHNSVDEDAIRTLVQAGYIVRTRADSGLEYDRKRTESALSSGAQILTTDFPPGEIDAKTGFSLHFEDGKTIRKNLATSVPD